MDQPKKPKQHKILRNPLKIAKHIYNLPQARADFETLHKDVEALSYRNAQLQKEVEAVRSQSDEMLESYKRRLQTMDDRLTDALHQVTILSEKGVKTSTKAKDASPAPSSDEQLMADEHLLDNFYVHFERWFRGTKEEITKNQSVYLPLFTESKLDSKKYPVVDVGCGNGEFVELLYNNGIRAIGLDLNKTMIDHVKSLGLEAEQGDALSFLRKQKSGSLMAITGFHIVEHIPFLDLIKIFNECYRVLAPGGFVIFETPNPENVIVGSCNFYNDPSHLHPLPPAFLELVMKTRGFAEVEVKKLHPMKKAAELKHEDKLVREMAERFFGPQDYAVVAHK